MTDFNFLKPENTAVGDCSQEKSLAPWKKSYDKSKQHIKKQRHHKGPSIQSYGFSCNHAQMWELDHNEGWSLKNWCFQIVVLGKTLERPLDWKEIKPLSSKGNRLWIFIGRTVTETPILWPPDAESRLIGKDHDAGKDWRQKEEGIVEDKTVGRHHWLNEHAAAAAAAAKSLQSFLTLCDPRDSSPPGSPIPGILQARILAWVAISFSNTWKWKVIVN